MSFLPFQAVVFDLDDTLLRDDRTISDFSLDILHALARKGVRLIPASGRARMSMKPFVDLLQDVPLYICFNGAEIRDGKSGRVLYSELFSAELGREIAAFGNAHHCYTHTYGGSCFYYNMESEWSRRYAESSLLTGILVGDLEAFIREPGNKILMMDAPEKISVMLTEARNLFQDRVSVTCSKPTFLEFNPPEATKGNALKRATGMLGLRAEDCIAFGDGLNDLSMLEVAGRGVLMANGRPALRILADDVCGSNQEDGVAVYLKNLFREVLA